MKTSAEFRLALSVIREEIAHSHLLPQPYDIYHPLLADGLRFFLERLSPSRLRRIVTQQLELPTSITTEERVAWLLCQAPVLHKLGQILARDRRLSAPFRLRLQRLESLEPQTSQLDAVRLLERELEDWRGLGIRLGPRSLAEGSVAFVMPFRLESQAGVIKLLKPHISDLLHEDLEILSLLGDFIDSDCARYHLPHLEYRETFDTIRDLLRQEVHLDKEQQHMREARQALAGLDSVVIPELFPFCTPRLTAMERLYGCKMPDWEGGPKAVESIARATVEALIAQPIFSVKQAALFHADPHAGNLWVTEEGKVGILDWSLVGHLPKEDRIQITQLILGALEFNTVKLARAVDALSLKPVNLTALSKVVDDSLNGLRWGAPGLSWLSMLLDDLVMRAGARFDRNLLLFRKTLMTLEGVLTDLGSGDVAWQRSVLDQTVMASFLAHWTAEWPTRFTVPITSRAMGTHVSTADALSLMWSSPVAMARWWSDAGWKILSGAKH